MKQRIQRQKWAQNKVTERRQQAARARKYYEDYRVQLRAKLLRARTREERVSADTRALQGCNPACQDPRAELEVGEFNASPKHRARMKWLMKWFLLWKCGSSAGQTTVKQERMIYGAKRRERVKYQCGKTGLVT